MGVLRTSLGALLALLAIPAAAAAQCSTDDLDMNGVPDVCPAGSNYIEGTAGPDTLRGTNGADCIFGLGGDDDITGRNGDDYICAGDGADVVVGSGDNDTIFGEGGNDDLSGGNGDDFIAGGTGDDTLDGSSGSDTVNGGAGNDVVDGGGGADIVSGEEGDDTVNGGGGNDSLSGGPGIDNLDGGGGTDTCVEEVPGTAERLTNCDVITYASISRVDVRADDDGVTLRWDTTAEVGTVAFRVWRVGPRRSLVWVGELATSAEGSPYGATYFLEDTGASTDDPLEYLIEERTISGGSVLHGPFVRTPLAKEHMDEYFGTLRGPRRIDRHVPLRPLTRPAVAESGVAFGRKDSHPPDAAEISVDRTGIIDLDATSIAEALQISPASVEDAIDEQRIRLSLRGEPVAWHAVDEGTSIRFLSHEVITPFTTTSRYLLSLGEGVAMERAALNRVDPSSAHTFVETRRVEENVFPGPSGVPDPRQDLFFWHALSSAQEVSIPISLPGLDGGSAETLRVVLHAATLHLEQPHRIELLWNGVSLGVFETLGRGRHTLSIPIDGLAAHAENELVVRQHVAGEVPPVVYLDAAEVDYPRAANADSPVFRFGAASDGVTSVVGLDSGPVHLYDVTDGDAPKYLGGLLVDESSVLSFVADDPGQRFLVAGAEDVRAPSSVTAHMSADLGSSTLGSEYLIIAASHLVGAARILAEYREADGYDVEVVDVDDVYWAFTGGEPDPLAIREFLAFAFKHRVTPPRYATLVGKGSVDYRDLLGLGGNWLPAPLTPTEGGLFPSDSMLGDVEGDDGVPEIAVGRLPIATEDELRRIVDSIERFETGHTSMDAVFVSDDSARGEFKAATDYLLPWAAEERTVQIDLNDESLDEARARLMTRWIQELSWLTYVGHGGLDRLADEGLLTSEDVPMLSQLDSSPMLVAWSCNIARFDLPGFHSLGERLVMEGASAGVFSATGWSNHVESDVMRTSFAEAAFSSEAETIGEAMLDAHGAAIDAPLTLHRVYLLLGDPALRLRHPKASPEPLPTPEPEPTPKPSDPPEAPTGAPEASGSNSGCEVAAPGSGRGPLGPALLLLWLALAIRVPRTRR